MDKQRFLDELNFISEKCASLAQEYGALRGAMNSMEGLTDKRSHEDFLKDSAIRFLNETKNLRVSRIVGVVWALSERANDRQKRSSSLSNNNPKGSPAKLDNIKYAGDMTLMRLRDMYRRAVELHPDILRENIVMRNGRSTLAEVSDLVVESDRTLSDLCNRIDEHLSDDDAWHKIEHFRNTFSHSIKFPKIAIEKNWTDKSPDYSYNNLYAFGDRAAQIAVDFRRSWTTSNTCSGADDMADLVKEEYDEFWMDFFRNPFFYES